MKYYITDETTRTTPNEDGTFDNLEDAQKAFDQLKETLEFCDEYHVMDLWLEVEDDDPENIDTYCGKNALEDLAAKFAKENNVNDDLYTAFYEMFGCKYNFEDGLARARQMVEFIRVIENASGEKAIIDDYLGYNKVLVRHDGETLIDDDEINDWLER